MGLARRGRSFEEQLSGKLWDGLSLLDFHITQPWPWLHLWSSYHKLHLFFQP